MKLIDELVSEELHEKKDKKFLKGGLGLTNEQLYVII